MKARITLKEIAKKFKVSISTVSKSINDSPEIGEETKIKIRAYANLKNYAPNRNAMNLKKGSAKTIAVIIPNVENSFFAKVLSGIEKIANEKKYNVIICLSNESLEKEMKIIEMLGNGTIDGLILSISSEAQKLNEYLHYKKIIKDGVPIVLFDRNSNQIKCDKVVGNDFDSALNATQHLINMDCKRIALISSIDNLFIGKLRAKGYLHALNKNNIDLNPNLIIKTDSDEDLKAQITNLLDNKSIDGIFALDEKESIYAIKICKEKGFQIPKEIKIIGFADGNLASKILSPSLTTISQRGKEVGQAAAKLLIDRLESDKQFIPYKTIIVQTKMKERESTIVSFQKRKKV